MIENPRFTNEEFEHAKAEIKEALLTADKSAYDILSNELYKGYQACYAKLEILKEILLDKKIQSYAWNKLYKR